MCPGRWWASRGILTVLPSDVARLWSHRRPTILMISASRWHRSVTMIPFWWRRVSAFVFHSFRRSFGWSRHDSLLRLKVLSVDVFRGICSAMRCVLQSTNTSLWFKLNREAQQKSEHKHIPMILASSSSFLIAFVEVTPPLHSGTIINNQTVSIGDCLCLKKPAMPTIGMNSPKLKLQPTHYLPFKSINTCAQLMEW